MRGDTTLPQLHLSQIGAREAMHMSEAPLDGVSTSAGLERKCLERKFMCFGLHPALLNIRANSPKTLVLQQLWQ